MKTKILIITSLVILSNLGMLHAQEKAHANAEGIDFTGKRVQTILDRQLRLFTIVGVKTPKEVFMNNFNP